MVNKPAFAPILAVATAWPVAAFLVSDAQQDVICAHDRCLYEDPNPVSSHALDVITAAMGTLLLWPLVFLALSLLVKNLDLRRAIRTMVAFGWPIVGVVAWNQLENHGCFYECGPDATATASLEMLYLLASVPVWLVGVIVARVRHSRRTKAVDPAPRVIGRSVCAARNCSTEGGAIRPACAALPYRRRSAPFWPRPALGTIRGIAGWSFSALFADSQPAQTGSAPGAAIPPSSMMQFRTAATSSDEPQRAHASRSAGRGSSTTTESGRSNVITARRSAS